MANYKEVIDLLKKGMTVDAEVKIMELRESDLERREEILKLKEKVQHLEAQLKKTKKVFWEKPFYWLNNDGNKDGPICPHCYDAKDKLIVRLTDLKNDLWRCNSCKNIYEGPNYQSPEIEPTRADYY